jgi:hypothetical protein
MPGSYYVPLRTPKANPSQDQVEKQATQSTAPNEMEQGAIKGGYQQTKEKRWKSHVTSKIRKEIQSGCVNILHNDTTTEKGVIIVKNCCLTWCDVTLGILKPDSNKFSGR